MTTSLSRMQQRRDSSADWSASNPVLRAGEIGWDTDLQRMKIGDGTTAWDSLAFVNLTEGDAIAAAQAAALDIATAPTDAQMASVAADTGSDFYQVQTASIDEAVADPTSDAATTIARTGVRPFPSGILGGNIVPRPDGDWRELAFNWDWTNWIKPQVDRARLLGMNLVRLILAPGVTLPKVSTGGSTAGTISSATYETRLRQLATYCAQQGLYLYVCLATDVDFVDVNAAYDYGDAGDVATGGGTDFSNATVQAAVADAAEWLAEYPNVVGFDVFQENPAGILEADILSLIDAVRAVAPRVPITSSISSGNWTNTAVPNAVVLYEHAAGVGSDFADFHVYTNNDDPTSPDYAISVSGGKPVLIGEFGSPVSAGQSAQEAVFENVAALRNRQGILGAIVWALADQGVANSLKYGVWDNTGFIPAAAPLSLTAGKRTYLTDRLTSLFQRSDPAPRYEPPELLTEVQIRPSLYDFGWVDAGDAAVDSHPLGLEVTCGAASTVVLSGDEFALTPGKVYRLRLESMRGTGGARAVYVYLTLLTSAGAFVANVGTGIVQNADAAIPNVHEVIWHFNAAAYPTVAKCKVRVSVTGATIGETHYILDGATLRATT